MRVEGEKEEESVAIMTAGIRGARTHSMTLSDLSPCTELASALALDEYPHHVLENTTISLPAIASYTHTSISTHYQPTP